MTKDQLMELVIQEISDSEIIRKSVKDRTIKDLKIALSNPARALWFEVRNILFQNRYSKISKEEFFDWLVDTHLHELVEEINKEVT